jgi:hypothetical protein
VENQGYQDGLKTVLMMRVGIKATILRDSIISGTPALATLRENYRESFSRGYSDGFRR